MVKLNQTNAKSWQAVFFFNSVTNLPLKQIQFRMSALFPGKYRFTFCSWSLAESQVLALTWTRDMTDCTWVPDLSQSVWCHREKDALSNSFGNETSVWTDFYVFHSLKWVSHHKTLVLRCRQMSWLLTRIFDDLSRQSYFCIHTHCLVSTVQLSPLLIPLHLSDCYYQANII